MSSILHRRKKHAPLWAKARAAALAFLLVWMTAAVLVLQQATAQPNVPADLVDFNYGVFERLSETQARKAEKTDSSKIAPTTDAIIGGLKPIVGSRILPSPAYTVEQSNLGIPQASPIFDVLKDSPLPNYASVFDFLITSGPLSYAVFTNCSGFGTWHNGSLRPTFNLQFTNGQLQFIDWEQWVPIDCAGNPATGDATGADLQVRMRPIVTNISFSFGSPGGGGLPQLLPTLSFFGGFPFDMEP